MAKGTRAAVSPLRIGNAVFIRTVTHHYTGRIVGLTDTEVLLEDVAWIADDGRFSTALREGKFSEVEPYPDGVVSVSRGALLDVCSWVAALPRAVQ